MLGLMIVVIVVGTTGAFTWGFFKFIKRLGSQYVCACNGCIYKTFESSEEADEGKALVKCERCEVVYHHTMEGKYKPWRTFYYAQK